MNCSFLFALMKQKKRHLSMSLMRKAGLEPTDIPWKYDKMEEK